MLTRGSRFELGRRNLRKCWNWPSECASGSLFLLTFIEYARCDRYCLGTGNKMTVKNTILPAGTDDLATDRHSNLWRRQETGWSLWGLKYSQQGDPNTLREGESPVVRIKRQSGKKLCSSVDSTGCPRCELHGVSQSNTEAYFYTLHSFLEHVMETKSPWQLHFYLCCSDESMDSRQLNEQPQTTLLFGAGFGLQSCSSKFRTLHVLEETAHGRGQAELLCKRSRFRTPHQANHMYWEIRKRGPPSEPCQVGRWLHDVAPLCGWTGGSCEIQCGHSLHTGTELDLLPNH